MQKIGERLVLSPSDLNDFLECEHKTATLVRRHRDGLVVPKIESPEAEILWRQGLAHEQSWLERFRNDGRQVVEVAAPTDDWSAAAEQTREAMRVGTDVVCLLRLLRESRSAVVSSAKLFAEWPNTSPRRAFPQGTIGLLSLTYC